MTATRSRKPRSTASEPTAVTVEDWGHARAQWLTLPSGAGRVLFTPTSLPRAILAGVIPDGGLEGMARQVALKGFDPDDPDVTEDDWRLYLDAQDWLIADSCKQPKITAEFVSQVDDGEPHMPFEDRALLWIATQHGVPAARALNTEGNQAEELQRTIFDLLKFREGAAGAQPAEDGPGAGGAAE